MDTFKSSSTSLIETELSETAISLQNITKDYIPPEDQIYDEIINFLTQIREFRIPTYFELSIHIISLNSLRNDETSKY